MIEAHNLITIAEVRHGFFTRNGGHSSGLYATLNCGLGSDDDAATVRRNRAHVATALGLLPEQLVTVYQVHSPQVVTVDAPWPHEHAPHADALVSRHSGIALAILTADCAPVLFADRHAGVIGAAHAGWRGALAGVCEATVEAMEALGAERENIFAAIGPTISQANYEVGDELRDTFLKQEADYEAFFAPGARPGHHQFDLPGFLRFRLAAAELGSVDDTGLCTYADEERFFSYRRATHRGEPDYGRQISAITLGPDAFLHDDA